MRIQRNIITKLVMLSKKKRYLKYEKNIVRVCFFDKNNENQFGRRFT